MRKISLLFVTLIILLNSCKKDSIAVGCDKDEAKSLYWINFSYFK